MSSMIAVARTSLLSLSCCGFFLFPLIDFLPLSCYYVVDLLAMAILYLDAREMSIYFSRFIAYFRDFVKGIQKALQNLVRGDDT